MTHKKMILAQNFIIFNIISKSFLFVYFLTELLYTLDNILLYSFLLVKLLQKDMMEMSISGQQLEEQ